MKYKEKEKKFKQYFTQGGESTKSRGRNERNAKKNDNDGQETGQEYQDSFLELERKLMLKDVLAFDPLNEQLIN